MSRPLDRSRTHIMRKRVKGGYLCMYHDDPGVYFDIKGNPISNDEASAAGFEIESDAKAATRLRLMEEARLEVEAKMREIEGKVEAQVEEIHEKPVPSTAPAEEVFQQKDEPEIVRSAQNGEPRETNRREMEHEGRGRWTVKSKATGKTVHIQETVDKETAISLLLEKVA